MNWTAPLNPLVTYFHYADWTPATYYWVVCYIMYSE